MESKAIIITAEMVDRLERFLNHLDRLSAQYWNKAEEAEKAGDTETAKKYYRKSDTIDEKQYGALKALNELGFDWKTTFDERVDGAEKFTLILP